jgi:hypothetical protein
VASVKAASNSDASTCCGKRGLGSIDIQDTGAQCMPMSFAWAADGALGHTPENSFLSLLNSHPGLRCHVLSTRKAAYANETLSDWVGSESRARSA